MPDSLNQKILDRSISHATFLRRLQIGESNRIVKLLVDGVHEPLTRTLASRLDRIGTRGFDTGPKTTKRIQQMLKRNSDLIREGMVSIYPELREELVKIGFMEADFQGKMINDALPRPLEVDFLRPAGTTLRSAVTSRPFNGRILRKWWQSVDVGARQQVNGAIMQGLARGDTTQEMMRSVRKTLQTTSNNAEAVVRTAVNHTVTQAREQTYKENADIVSRVRFVATLDSRTTPSCAALDGKEFPVGDGPRPPIHFGCRSTTVPVLKPLSQLGIPGLKDIPEGTRSSVDGPVTAKETYGTWLKRQSAEDQNKVLGAGNAKLFRTGQVKIERFVDSDYKPLSLKQVLKREGLDSSALN